MTLSNQRILLLDDDPKVLEAYQRGLRRRFQVEVAEGPRAGLTKILTGEPYAVVVADMLMPGISGLDLLQRLKEFSPHSVGIICTGMANLSMAVDAMNQGIAYRFLTKPCPMDKLIKAIEDALEFHRLQACRHEYRQNELEPLLRLVAQQLASQRKEFYGRKFSMAPFTRQLCDRLKLPNPGDFEIAATFVELAWCSANEELQRRLHGQQPVDEDVANSLFEHEREFLRSLLGIGGVQALSEMLLCPNDPWTKAVPSDSLLTSNRRAVGGHLLHLARDFSQGTLQANCLAGGLIRVKSRKDHYHPQALAAVEEMRNGVAVQLR